MTALFTKKKLIGLFVILLIAGTGYWFVISRAKPNNSTQSSTVEPPKLTSYVDLYYQITLPNTQKIEQSPEITGNKAADDHIRGIAEQKGYKLQSESTGSLVEVDSVRLQESAAKAWQELKAAAAAEGVHIVIISGHRGIATQRSIFLNQLDAHARAIFGRPFTEAEIASARADTAINAILNEYSLPGYSKHHTGYALDITDAASGSLNEIKSTPVYNWITKDNYKNMRAFGFIPSYPEEAKNQGPNPEPWEYIWVGQENITKLTL